MMGCMMSVKKNREDKNQNYNRKESRNSISLSSDSKNCNFKRPSFVDQQQRFKITEEQKQMVSDTWDIVRQDITRVGVITFLRLFEKHPDVQDLFVPFRGLETDELKNNVRLREHGLRVMGTIEKAIARLHKPDKMCEMLYELGEKHVMYDTKVDYLELIGPVLIHSIQPAIGEKWTPEVEEAWLNFLTTITTFMKLGMGAHQS